MNIKISIFLDLNRDFDFHIVNKILINYNYNCKLFLFHINDDITNTLIYKKLSYLDDNIVFENIKNIKQNGDRLILLYYKFKFSHTLYLHHMHKFMKDNMNLWFEYSIEMFFHLIKLLVNYNSIQNSNHKVIYFTNDMESYSSFNFKKEFIMENNIHAININYSGELIFDNDYFDDGYDITNRENNISKIIDGFYIGDTPCVNNRTERFISIKFILDNLDDYMNYESNTIYMLHFVEESSEYSFTNNIAPTILDIISCNYNLINKNYHNKPPDNEIKLIDNSDFIYKYIQRYVNIKFKK